MRDEKGRFQPGYSGNPGGRPANQYRKEFAEGFYSVLAASEAGERLAQAFLEALEKGHLRAAAMIHKTATEYTEGKPGVRKGEVDESASELIERFADSYNPPELGKKT